MSDHQIYRPQEVAVKEYCRKDLGNPQKLRHQNKCEDCLEKAERKKSPGIASILLIFTPTENTMDG